MTVRFFKCLMVVALVHVFAAALVYGAYHFTRAGNNNIAKASAAPADQSSYTIMATDQQPSTTVAPVAAAKPVAVKHVVKGGESYWTIAKKYNVTPKQLMSHNGHRTGHILQRGEVLVVPNR